MSKILKLKILLALAFSGIATGVTTTEILSVNSGILFGVLCVMFYTSLSIFDTMSAESVKELRRDIIKEMDYLRNIVTTAEDIPSDSRLLVAELFNTLENTFLESALSLEFLKSNNYSIEESTSTLLYISRLNIAKYENKWERMGVDADIIRSFRKLTERDVVKFFESVSRIIKSEPFLYRRQKVFKREMILLVKDVVYDYFMFLEDRSQQGLV